MQDFQIKLSNVPESFLAEMELENKTVRKADSDDGQISFEILNRDILADRLRKTNVAELTDSECREMLEELAKLAD